MIFASASTLSKRKKAGMLIVPFWKTKKSVELACKDIGKLNTYCSDPISTDDFKGKEGEVSVIYMSGQPEKRLLLLGLGEQEKVTVEKLRRSFAQVVKATQKCEVKDINILMPLIDSITSEEVARGIAEGILMINYSFDKLKHHSIKDKPTVLLTHANFIEASKKEMDAVKKALNICKGVYLTRDLVNGNADDITPQHLADVAKGFAKQFTTVKTTVLDKKRLEKEKLGLLLAVGRGSPVDPVLIISEYKGDPKGKDLTVVVGKGVTFDTGGLNLKPTGHMEDMKYDMAGAATALGILFATASLKLKINLTVVVPSTENSITGNSYKPGDVYTSYDGKTVEIGNTDAEGRLILADALAYTHKNLKPSRIIDFATLTGAIVIALGKEAMGMMSNDEKLSEQLINASQDTSERAHALPMYEDYRECLNSDIADIKNIGGRGASSITAAFFLKEFVGNTPWAHFDIAGTSFSEKKWRYFPHHATGTGVRLILSFLEELAQSHAGK